jgi:diguanylate cyclase (GGDEF)-like protein
MIISILVIIIAYVADPYYWISPEGDLASMYYPMMISIPVLYLIASLVLSVINARKVDSRDEKKNCWLIGIFPLGVLVSGLIQVLSLKAPTYCFGCTIMLLFFYIQNMQTQISLDGLTRLNNRGQINRYMEQMNDREVYSEFTREISVDYNKVFIMMIDVDQFKQINDTYGHSEGDRALIMVADTLRLVGENMKALVFLGIYGGDEFTVIIHNAEEEEYPKQIAEAISRTLSEKAQTAQLPYELKVSIGYAEQVRYETMQECLVRADEMLYQVKRANKIGR